MLPELLLKSFLIYLAMCVTSSLFNWTVKSESRDSSNPTLLNVKNDIRTVPSTQETFLKKLLDECLLVCFPIKLDSDSYIRQRE